MTFEDQLAQQLGLAGYGVTQKRGPASGATRKFYNYHEGTDYGTPAGTPIKPQFKGVYQGSINDNTGYGTRAVIYNPQNNETYYMSHLSRLSGLQPGQSFDPGTVIGYTGGIPGTPGAGNTTGQHLDVVTKGGQQAPAYNFASALASAVNNVSQRVNPMDVINRVKQQFGNSAAAVASDPNRLRQLAASGKYKNARIVKVTV